MGGDNITRKNMIAELEKLSECVHNLKQEHRQKRPIVIEFSGSPKAGKTSCINSLELFLKRNGFTVKIVQEKASICPVTDKQSPMFNIWTSCMSLAEIIGTLTNKKNTFDVLIVDRGIFDALCWFEWLVKTSKMDEKQREVLEKFLLMDNVINYIDIVFSFVVDPKKSIEREYANLLTDKRGSIMNENVLGEYLKSVDSIISTKREYFHKVIRIDTSDKTQNEVSKEVTEKTLDNLKELLMEKVGYLKKNDILMDVLNSKNFFLMDELQHILPNIEFDQREKVENNNLLLQPIPIAIISNKSGNKVLMVKKNKTAVSMDSPEKDKWLIYVGGHSRQEDATDILSNDFLGVCRVTLKREIDEEIGVSVALGNIEPFFIYTPTSNKSKNHLAVCFKVIIDEETTKFRLDPHELTLNKGKSKSGKLIKVNELEYENLEDWSRVIIENCFKEHMVSQLSIFDI